jgi:drug/metabolite transporter (DMT)-like permease
MVWNTRASPRLSIVPALGAAVLFGLAAPGTKLVLNQTEPWLVAGLLYLGSGLALTCIAAARRRMMGRGAREARLTRRDLPWIAGAILAGGVAGPVLLMFGLSWSSASESALLLNLEGVFTGVLAWCVFREHVDVRVGAGRAAITLGAVVLAWSSGAGPRFSWSALAVAGACLMWAIDNNLTRKIASRDPVHIAALKGLIAGTVNFALALVGGARVPETATVVATAAIGATG